MSLIYGIGIPTLILPDSPTIDAASIFSRTCINTSQYVNIFLPALNSTDFQVYEDRKLLLRTLLTLPQAPELTRTASFDPLEYLLDPPFEQTRFPAIGAWFNLTASPFQSPVTLLRAALDYRDGEPDYDAHATNFEQARATLNNLATDPLAIVNRLTFELRFILVWSPWPNPDVPPTSGHTEQQIPTISTQP
jgi:hypothetical protein